MPKTIKHPCGQAPIRFERETNKGTITRGIVIILAWLLAVIIVLPRLMPPADNTNRPPMHHY